MTKSIIEIVKESGGLTNINSHFNALSDSIVFDPQALEAFATAIKAAHLAELAVVEMPEPAVVIRVNGDKHTVYPAQLDDAKLFTLDQCQQAVAAAVARTKLECKK